MPEPRRNDQGGLLVTPMRLDDLGPDQLAEWSALHRAQDGVANPFSSPLWVTSWYRQFVQPEHQHLLWVTHRDQLVAVVPLQVQSIQLARVPVARRLALVGGGRTTPLEIPPLLSSTGESRAIVRAVVTHALTQDVSWSELTLSREQGWLNAHLASSPGQPPVFQRHQQVRACVVLRLADTWDETRSGLRRNVKESVRRARNRLAKDGRPWEITHRTGDDLNYTVIERFLRLHAARSEYQETTSQHHDAFADQGNAYFLRELLPRLGREGEASIVELQLDGDVVASQLVLHPPGGIYFHSSGFRPDVWELSPVTALQVSAMEHAVARGDRWVNFSPGPNEAKLRWSDRLLTFDDFAFGAATHPTLARYTVFFLAKDIRQLRLERNWVREATTTAAAAPKMVSSR